MSVVPVLKPGSRSSVVSQVIFLYRFATEFKESLICAPHADIAGYAAGTASNSSFHPTRTVMKSSGGGWIRPNCFNRPD